MSDFVVIPCEVRETAARWSVHQLGLPEGFDSMEDYLLHIAEVYEDSGLSEFWVVNPEGHKVAYFTCTTGMDAHHKGTILDVCDIVIKPGSGRDVAVFLMRELDRMAVANDCSWVSRCTHQPDGSVKMIFRRVNNG